MKWYSYSKDAAEPPQVNVPATNTLRYFENDVRSYSMQEIEYEYEYRPPRRTEYAKAGNQRLPSEIPKQPNNSLKTGRERP